MRRAGVVMVAALALAGCGGGASKSDGSAMPSSPPASSSASATLSPTPTPSPSPWTKEEAAAKYLEMVAPMNEASKALGPTFMVDEGTWVDVKGKCANLESAAEGLLQGMSAGLWPDGVQPEVDAVMRSVAAEQEWYRKCSLATDMSGITTLGDVTIVEPGSGRLLRLKLGLPAPS